MANSSNKYYQVGLDLCKYWIVYDKLSNESVVAHFDSDQAQDLESHKSMTSYFTLIAYEVTSQMSCQQKTIALSLTNAEYIAFSDYNHRLVWTRNLLNKVIFSVPTPYIYGNNHNSLF